MNGFGIGISLPMYGILAGDPKNVILRDRNNGVVVSHDFDKDNPTWELKNNGLTATQAKNITQALVTPSGEAYVAYCYNNASGAFIAYAPSIGADFTIIEDHTTITAKLGTNTETYICAIGIDKISGRVGYVIGKVLSGTYTTKLYLGTGTTFVEKGTITGAGGGSNNVSLANLSFGDGKWFFTSSASSAGDKQYWRISGDGMTVESTADIGDDYTCWHRRAGDTSKVWMFTRFDNKMDYTPDNGTTLSTLATNVLRFTAGTRYSHNQLAVDDSGLYLMAPALVGGSTVTAKSSDGGVSWVSGGSLPTNKTRSHFYCGTGPDGPRFVAAGSAVYYTKNFGVDWLTKTGNLTSLIASPTIDLILAV